MQRKEKQKRDKFKFIKSEKHVKLIDANDWKECRDIGTLGHFWLDGLLSDWITYNLWPNNFTPEYMIQKLAHSPPSPQISAGKCVRMFPAALLLIVSKWWQSKYLSQENAHYRIVFRSQKQLSTESQNIRS